MKKTLLALSAILILTGCGDDKEQTKDKEKVEEERSETQSSKIGYLVDSPISGLEYECCGAKEENVTKNNGEFSCSTLPIRFKIGNYIIGSISKLPEDSKIYPQDIIGVPRDNYSDAKLVELTQFLQALDPDNNIEERIGITQEVRDKFEKVYGIREGAKDATFSCSQGFASDNNNNSENSNISQRATITPSDALGQTGIPIPDPQKAMTHLEKNISPENYTPADTSDMSDYVGKWVGGGWSWEVRFKQNYGEFISNLTGIEENKLPDDIPYVVESKEKNIMSLLVSHHTAFAFEVDKDGDIQGTGTITYDLLPNLCGLHALTSNVINPNVQLFDKIFALGGIVSMNTDVNYMTKGVNLDTKIISAAQEVFSTSNAIASFKGMDWSSLAKNTFEKGYIETKSTNDMCSLVSENPKIKGGLGIGPMSVDELLTGAGVNMGKAVMDTFFSGDAIGAMAGFMLNVPGLTQIQYYYKGLKDGPEKRVYALSGHIDNKGKMFLKMDGLKDGGSKDLVIEYMVNYKKENPTFPIWSPFLKEPATVYPANRDYLIYEYQNKDIKREYNAYDANSGKATKKSINVSTPIVKTKKDRLEFPMASFKASGTKRNGIDIWHEYEYSWNAYKVSDD